ncbi:MAG: hypothetical protein FWD93_03240 [Coriobacteriia bacterium]|nr:hypothetical protein [Coriobacteriia bacterium]
MDRRAILENLEQISSLSVCSVNRAANMLMLGFGDLVQAQNFRGETLADPQFSLHIDCPWRIVFCKSIVLASWDVFEPSTKAGWTEDFEWDCPGANLFDEKSKTLIANDALHVKGITADNFGGFCISFDNGYVLEVFPCCSADEESWRLFEANSEYGFVVNGKSFYSYSDIDGEDK